MNRDALLASLIGFGIGLLITGILLVGPNVIKGFPAIKLPSLAFSLPKKNDIKTTPTATPTPAVLGIASPANEEAVSTSDLVVTGVAPASSTVVVAGPNDEDVVVVKDDGKYAGKITLTEGKNDIVVTSYVNGKGSSQSVTVFYTKENW
ncbi:hypothetical protein HYV22_01150 [Candidatus Gottesmanbacteria bacterium]|nr:hypothetical protein [Candidatus Gottesmanbacteria bacterium]